jgi:cyclopropane-fatty-acyl-phospholipid synthase
MASLQKPTERTCVRSHSHLADRNDDHLGIALFRAIWGDLRSRDFAVRFWDGATWDVEAGRPRRFTLVLESPDALSRIFTAPTDLALGEAYVFQDIDIEGDVESALDLADEILQRRSAIGLVEGVRIWLQLRRLSRAHRAPSTWHQVARFGAGGPKASLPVNRTNGVNGEEHNLSAERWSSSKPVRKHTPAADRSAIAHHYDVSNEFYQLWLDQRMVYSCAYFAAPDEDLDSAQARKLGYVCRKLRLRPGERFLDLGCGWGGLVIHAAQHFGVDAFGITLSHEQAEFAHRRIQELGLSGRCRVEHRDYRSLALHVGSRLGAGADQTYDKIACIGMFEHVGEANLERCLSQTFDLVKPGGVFLFHGITRGYHFPLPEPSFVTRYVFPNGELVPISTVLQAAERVGFEVRDLESLREHYVLTLRRWVERLEAKRDGAIRLTDPETYRVWKLFMAGSAQRFRVNQLNLHQVLLSRPDIRGDSGLPLTRADWYGPASSSAPKRR